MPGVRVKMASLVKYAVSGTRGARILLNWKGEAQGESANASRTRAAAA
jgi:hypothetical protein